MAPQSSFRWLSWLFLITLAACTARVQTSPTADQKAIASSVAETIKAAATATQRTIPTSLPKQILSPTPEPTLPEPILPLPSPTIAPSPTTSILAPSSMTVAYTKSNDVYMWTPEDGSIRLTDMQDVVSVRLSGDGSLVAFKRQDPNNILSQELWVVNTHGVPNPRLLVTQDDLDKLLPPNPGVNVLGYGILSYTWRPHTHDLAYNTVVLHEGPGFGPNNDLRLVNADTLEKTSLIDTSMGGIFYYSPDGNRIALSKPDHISLIDADGSHLQDNVLTFPKVLTYSEYEYTPHPIWAADSSSLLVAIPPEDPLADPRPDTSLWSVLVDSSPPVLLSRFPAMAFSWPDNAISPNLEQVAYSSPISAPELNQRRLIIANADGTHAQAFDQGESLEFLAWSPDSQNFIYRILSGTKEGLYLGGLAESPIQFFSDPHAVLKIVWLDGIRFVYLVNVTDQWQLHLSDNHAQDLALLDAFTSNSPDFDLVP